MSVVARPGKDDARAVVAVPRDRQRRRCWARRRIFRAAAVERWIARRLSATSLDRRRASSGCLDATHRRRRAHACRRESAIRWDWSADGARILHNCPHRDRRRRRSVYHHATPQPPLRHGTIVADPGSLRCVKVASHPTAGGSSSSAKPQDRRHVSVLGVVPASGGKWTRAHRRQLVGGQAALEPRRPNDLFHLQPATAPSSTSGVFRLIRTADDAAGEEFRVTRNDSPSRTVAAAGGSELGVSRTWLVVPIVESKGSVWLLDGVAR